eukprot:TRINITY_DN31113_c0_g1_i1.p1 TRINITY_DN31113_c0_g1~~TRINITY_DN31113_c0_g1_i1.p1  ORF type:complete len:352 (+),score=43.76 TRINITY_DN31113_c0_g1_i1:63-1118(+)
MIAAVSLVVMMIASSCWISPQSAASSAALRSPAIQRQLTIFINNDALDIVAVESPAGRESLLRNLVGTDDNQGWEAVKQNAVPDFTHITAENGPGNYSASIVLNLTVVENMPADEITLLTIEDRFTMSGMNITCNSTYSIDEINPQIESLKTVFDTFDGYQWLQSTGWLADYTTACSWHGVSCFNGSVVGIFLSGNRLSGELTDVFPTLFPDIEFLHLSHNNISGTLHESFTLLTNLRTLDLSNNIMSGDLPQGGFPSLESLLLHGNTFEGTIPDWNASSPALTTVLLQNNQLTGFLPDWCNPQSSLYHSSLRKLWAYGNNLNETYPESDSLALEESKFPYSPDKESNRGV